MGLGLEVRIVSSDVGIRIYREKAAGDEFSTLVGSDEK